MRVVALVSGGIDSPVAAWMMLRKGVEVIPLFFDNDPFSFEDNRERARASLEALRQHAPGMRAYSAPHGESMVAILNKCPRRLTCVLCRRAMFRAAEAFARQQGADALVTGEFLGSKASQTARNLAVVAAAVAMPVIRPLVGLNKEEIAAFARIAGTYKVCATSAACCTATPEKPSTCARMEDVLNAERQFLDVAAMALASASAAREFA